MEIHLDFLTAIQRAEHLDSLMADMKVYCLVGMKIKTMADQMASSTSMAGQTEVTTADWMVQTTATTMVDHSATKMDDQMVKRMAGWMVTKMVV